MRGAILMFSAGVFMSGLGGCPLVEAHGAGTVYVAPDGDDGWSGTLPATNQERTDGPFKTLGRAGSDPADQEGRGGESNRSGARRHVLSFRAADSRAG